MRVRFRRGAGLALAVAGLLPACAQSPAQPPPVAAAAPAPAPSMWLADDPAAGAFYLLGSVHLRAAPDALGRRVDEAWKRSEELVVEVDISTVDEQQTLRLAQRYGLLPAGSTLAGQLSDDTGGQLDRYLASRGIDPAMLASFRPWFAAITLLQMELAGIGYSTVYGVDRALIERAVGEKPIVPLETIEFQLGTMANLSESLQEVMLLDMLTRADDLADEMRRLVSAWERGDDEALERITFSARDEVPGIEPFFEQVFFERNRNMAERLDELADDGKTRLAVIGAGHLLGDEGIPQLLAKRGFCVRRLGTPADVAKASCP